MKMMTIAAAMICALLASGCGKRAAKTNEAQPPPAAEAPPPAQEKSLTRQAIEGVTGKTAVDAGQRTKAKVAAIDAQEQEKNKGLDDIMSE